MSAVDLALYEETRLRAALARLAEAEPSLSKRAQQLRETNELVSLWMVSQLLLIIDAGRSWEADAQAMASGDVVAMIRAYQKLQGVN